MEDSYFFHFKEQITLFIEIKVTEPTTVKFGIMIWLYVAPVNSLEKNHTLTTMFDAYAYIVQWYIDICGIN